MKPLQSKKFYPITTTLMVVLLSMVFSANVRAQSCCEGTQAQTAKTIFVTPSGNDANDGRSWDTAKKSLRSALNSTSAGDIIQVAQGEYFENINLADGINLLGGFIPGGTVRTPYGSIINGGGKGTVIKASNVNNCILDGFTIKNGNYESGGGLFIQGGSLTISRNLIENNQAGVGGGAYLAGFRGKFSRNTVRANTASVGGGIYCSGLRAEAVIERNDISGNNADNSGAGLYLSSSSGGVQNNTISNNTVPKGPGGAVYVADFSGLFSNNLLHHNTANVGAGGYLVDISSGGSFLNNTIADNSAGGTGGGVMFGNFAGEIRNCIIWGNTSDTNHQIFSNEASNRITYSNIEGGYTGTGNLNTDPLFSADYQLAGGSPSINAGSDGTNMGHTGGQAQRVNRGPVAVCPGNTTVDIATDKKYCDGADVLLSGCNSYDPDGDPLTYLWTWEGGSAVGKCVKPFFGLGAHAVTLTVSDGEFDSSCSFEVNITCTAVCSIKILEPANGYCFTDLNDNNPQITVRGIVASGKPCEVYVGGILTTVDANGNFSVNIPLTGGQGQYEIAASAAVCGTQCADEILITYDETPPQITCPGNITIEQQDNSGFPASKLPDAFKAAATDNVDTHPTITDDRPDTFPVGDTTVTFVATDYCGHSSQCEAVVTVKDTIVPVFGGTTTPTTITIEQEVIEGTPKTSSRLTDFFDVIAADNVDGVISVENNAPDIFPPDCTPVTFKACDTAGNCSEFIKTVCVDDTTSPVMVKPADITLECGGACTASSLLPPEFICTATDAVDGESGVTSDAPECLPLGETAITFCATDNSGNQACCTAAVTVIDTAAPRFSRTATTITIEQEGKDGTKANSAQLSDFFNVTAADVCDGAVVAGNNAPVIFPPGCTDVTFTACDQSGNCAVMKDSVCDYDTAAPAITCPSDLALKCTGGCTPLPDGTVFAATAIDAVDGELEVASNAPACFNLGVTEVTFSATDQAGKKADCKAKVTVTDTAAPVISCPEKVTLECAGQDGTPSAKLPETFKATASDECDSAVTITNNIPANFNKGENTVAFTATDDSGNVSTCTAPVSVKDTTVPNISCPANITLECEGTTGIAKTSASLAGFTATATDVCDNSLVLSHNMPEYFATGTTTAVTFSAVDDAGLSASCTATVTVKDTIAPVIACPGRTIINKSSELDRTKFNAVCSDLCSKTTGSNNLPADLDDLRKGENPITFTCKDEYGNSSSCTAVLEIQTGNDPIIYCPSDLTICEGDSIPDSHKATAYDHKGNPLPVTRSISANPPLGVHTVTWTATDSKGRKASCTSKVTVITCAVRITCPNNLTVVQTIDAGIPFSSIAGNFRATAVDYKNAALSVTHDAPTTLPVGTTTVIFTAADSGGRKASCSATVTVTSKPIPQPEPVTLTITCPGDRNVECGTIAISGFTAASNIAGVTITDDRPAVFSGCNTTTVVTFTAQDNSGNTAGCSSAVSVTDSVAPKITCPGNMLLTTASEFKAENFQAAATDSCGTVLIVDNLPPNNNFSIGINYITFTATDQCGNSAACTAAVTLEPGNAPTIICPADLTIEQTTDAGIYFSSIAASFQATAYDHKGNALTVTNNAPSILPPGSTVVTFTATDSKLSKKSSSCMATVTVTKHVEEPKTEVTSEDKETEENAGDTNSLSDTSADTSGNSGSSDNNTSGTTGDNDSGASGNIVSGDNGGSGTNNTSGSAGNTGTNGDTTGAAGNNESVGTTGGSDDNSGSATNNATGSVGDNASGASGNTTSGDNSGSATDNTTGSTGDKTGTTGDTTGAAGNNESAGNNDSGNAITATVLTVSVVSGDGGQPDLSANENPAGASGSADTTPAAGNEPGKPEAPAPMVVIVSPIDGAIVRTNQITVIYLVNGLNKSVTKDLTEGKNVITVSETNEAGVSGSDSIVVTYDPNTVLLSILSPANGTVVTSSPVRITYLLEGMTKSVNRALVEGENTITVTDTDSTGQAQSAAVNIILDSTAPKVVITSPGNGVVLAVSPITVNYLVDGNARAKSQTLTEGLNIIVVEESDSLGRVGSDSVAVTLKSTAPKVVITSPENEAVVAATPITVTYTVDGVVKTLLRELGAGENTVEVVETDVFGRKGKAQIEVTLNSKAPNVRITSPKNAAVVEASPVNVTYTVDNKKAKTVSKDLGEGINVITIKEESNSGKSSITGSDSITVTLDKTPPAVNIISPKDGSLVSQSPLVVVYTLDGIIKTSVKELEEGVNNLVIEEKDALGRSGSASVKVIFDAHIPLVNITSPANNSVLTTTPVLVSYNVEGKAKSVTWDLQAGQNIITVQEAAGNGLVGMASISVIYKPSAESALLLCPQDVTLEQQSPQGTRITLQAVSADSNNPLTDIGSDAPEVFPSGTTIVTFSGKNPQGEIVNCSSKVTVIDTTPPIIDLLLSPRKEEYNNTEILSIGYVITDKGDSNPMVKLELNNGHQTVDITAPSPIMLNLAHYVGDNTLIITTIDSYGNKANSTASFKVVEKVNAQ